MGIPEQLPPSLPMPDGSASTAPMPNPTVAQFLAQKIKPEFIATTTTCRSESSNDGIGQAAPAIKSGYYSRSFHSGKSACIFHSLCLILKQLTMPKVMFPG